MADATATTAPDISTTDKKTVRVRVSSPSNDDQNDDSHSNHRFSKYHGFPGSIHAKQLHFKNKNYAYTNQDIPAKSMEAKMKILKQKQRHRIGHKKEFSTSTYIPLPPKRPERALSAVCISIMLILFLLSQYQAEKIEYNYRAPTCFAKFHEQSYIPKNNKFEVSKERFLNSRDRQRCVHLNISPRKEAILQYDQATIAATTTTQREWNACISLDPKQLKTADSQFLQTAKEAKSRRTPKDYRNPAQLTATFNQTLRDNKIRLRQS